jgi:hypothetical protein
VRSGSARRLALDKQLLKTEALLLESVEKAAGPDEFGSQDTERQEDGEPAGPGEDDQDDTDGEEGKAKEDFEEALGLLKGAKEHSRTQVVGAAEPPVHSI